MAGIYLHIPFCRQACTYCNFHFTTSLRYKDGVVNAIAAEAVAEREWLSGETIETIYFGGGTPSLLSPDELNRLLTAIRENYSVSPDAEITLEANPDDISEELLLNWKALGINRLSIGVQSFIEEELRWMNRAHNSNQALSAVQLAQKYFENITIDFIYGSPFLSDEAWNNHLDLAISLRIPHLSCYALTVEEKTPLHKQIQTSLTPPLDEEKAARHFLILMERLRNAGYEHYEVSNFALPHFRSRHNSAYWKGVAYLGLGPSAHSYRKGERRWNIANNSRYIEGIEKGSPVRETEILSQLEIQNETTMIALRTMEGLSLDMLPQKDHILKKAEGYVSQGLARISEGRLQLTDEGMLRADGIAASLFV